MRIRAERVLAGIAAVLITVLLGTTAAHADDPPGGPFTPRANRPRTFSVVRIQSSPTGVTIFISVSETQPGDSTAPSIGSQFTSGSSGPACSAQPALIGNASRSWFEAGAASHPDQVPYALYCDGAFQGIVWLPATANPSTVRVTTDPGGSVDPRSLAQSLLDSIQLPEITIGVNPGTGLVALTSWFWVEGYDGTPITRSASLGGVTVEVELTPSRYHWTFGDGADMTTTSLGRRYPAESDLKHTYEQSSLRAGGAYTVTLEVTFTVQVRVNDGTSFTLAPITRSFTSAYPVQQAQSVLTGR